jgi:hypothetical protein
VVDAEDLLLVDDVLERGVEAARALQVEAEGLLDDQPGALDESFAPQHRHHVLHGGRRHREVEQPPYVAGHALLRRADGGRQVGAVVAVGGTEGDAGDQVVGDGVVEVVDALGEPLAHLLAELLVAAGGVPAGTDDGVLVGQQAPRGERVEAGEELACGEVARGTEEDQDVRWQVGHAPIEATRGKPAPHLHGWAT